MEIKWVVVCGAFCLFAAVISICINIDTNTKLSKILSFVFCIIGFISLIAFLFSMIFGGTKEINTSRLSRKLEGVSTQQYIYAEGRFTLGSGYITASTDNKYRYYYKEQNGDIKADVAEMSHTTIKYYDGDPYVDIQIDRIKYFTHWLIFSEFERYETNYYYTFYVPEGSVMQSYTFN